MLKEPILYIHPAALYIPYKGSIKQHLAWLYFVHHSREEIESKKSFVITLQDLKDGINYKSEKNNQVLIQSIKKLTKVRVQFDMFNPGTDWPSQALLQRCQVPKYTGGCRYSFHPDIHEALKQSEDKKPLRLDILKNFRSKHTLALYCLLISRLSQNITYTEINMNLNELTQFLGYSEDDVLLPGDLKRKVVQQVKKELNQSSDLSVHIDAIQEKRRKIKGFKFIAQLKPNHHNIYQQIYASAQTPVTTPTPPIQSPPPPKTVKKVVKSSPTATTPAREPLRFTIESFTPTETKPPPAKDIDLNAITHPKIKEEALKRFQKRLESHYKSLMQDNMQQHLEANFSQYQTQFIEILEKSVNAFMLRNITNRNMGRKNPQLMKLSQTVADGIMENAEAFDFSPPTFEDWKSQFEIDTNNKDTLNNLKQDALKAAKQIYRY